MTERSSDADKHATPADQNATSEDIATLYSRASMQGDRYWDFSASRKEVRGQFRDRMVREQAERAGAVPQPGAVPQAVASPHRPREQDQAPLLHPPQFPAPYSERQSRSGPVRVPEPGSQAEMREVAASRVAAPRRAQPPSREEAPTRWFAMHSVFAPAEVPMEIPSPPQRSPDPRPPMAAVFSLAGGVGKTCLVATLGRALSGMGEHLLLADTAAGGLLPFYFGSREFKPGVVRTFSSPARRGETDAPVSVLNLEAEQYPGDGGEHDALLGELVRDGRGVSRILVDIATASREVTGRLLLLRPTIIVPLLPDMSSLASLGLLENFLGGADGRDSKGETLYLLNQFDASVPLHLDVREMLQQQLGDRLLPFVLRRSPAVSEALAEGMTVIDYAPGSAAAEDYWNLAGWLRNFAAPAPVGYGGARWSER